MRDYDISEQSYKNGLMTGQAMLNAAVAHLSAQCRFLETVSGGADYCSLKRCGCDRCESVWNGVKRESEGRQENIAYRSMPKEELE